MVGNSAGRDTTTGSKNTFIGAVAGRLNTTGSCNHFIGRCAGFNNSTGNGNVFLGEFAGRDNTSGSYNVFLGDGAGRNNTTSFFNIAIGSNPGNSSVMGTGNQFIGAYAGKVNTGDYNILIGHCAGCDLSSGSCNIYIGKRFGTGTSSGSNQVVIDSGTGNVACFSGSFSSWASSSDCRDKTNIGNLREGKDFLAQLRPVKFEWDFRAEMKRDTPTQGTEEAGFLAQEVLEVVEANNADYLGLVGTNDPENLTLAKANFVPVLVKAVQELTTENQELRTRLEALEAHVGITTT